MVCCARVRIDGGTTPVFVIRLLPFFDDDDGIGIIVGWWIPPVVDTNDFSELDDGGDDSFVRSAAWKTVHGNWRDLDWDVEIVSVTSPSSDKTSKC